MDFLDKKGDLVFNKIAKIWKSDFFLNQNMTKKNYLQSDSILILKVFQ